MNNTLIITAKLETRAALHIGAGKGESEFDALLRRTAAGDAFIPGSALAGALRAVATRLAPRIGSKVCQAFETNKPKTPCGCMVCHLFGDVNPQEVDTENEGGRASRLWVYDATLQTDEKTWIRDGVGIDRATGAAARQGAVKFDLEVLPAKAIFDLRLELEDANDADRQLLAVTLAEWKAGRGAVGGRVARGLGALKLEGLAVKTRNLNTKTALMSYLRGEADAGLQPIADDANAWIANRVLEARDSITPEDKNPDVAHSWVELKLTLQAIGPLLVNDPTQAGRSGFDHAPLIEGKPILPGSSLRGALRSHAERIARTLATEHAVHGDDFLATCPACNPVARPRGKEDLALECCDSLLKRQEWRDPTDSFWRDPDQGIDTTHDLCLACQLFGSPRWGSRLIVEDAALEENTTPVYKVQDFLAIDRFTGGGKDGAKFDAAALWQPRFITHLRLENPQDWELGWLVLVLRDLAEGWLKVGFGAAKGFGQVWVPKWTATIGFIADDDFPLRTATSARIVESVDIRTLLHTAKVIPSPTSIYQIAELNGELAQPKSGHDWNWQMDSTENWQPVIKAWITAFNTYVEGFKRSPVSLPELKMDTYFDGGLIERLYPKASAAIGGKS